jgi:hypothetical protein
MKEAAMNMPFNKLSVAALALVVLAGLGLSPAADAQRGGGGGGGGGRAAGGGGERSGGADRAAAGTRNVQASNQNADKRTADVRNTSVNNVNVSRDVNVNVSGNNSGCCNNGWDNDHHHPVAAAAVVVGTVAAIGSMVRTVPANCVPVSYGGLVYQQCGSTWYQPQGSQFVVVNPPY